MELETDLKTLSLQPSADPPTSHSSSSSSSSSSSTPGKYGTYWKRITHSGDRPWTLRWSKITGCAAFATRSFKKGDKICSELPLVSIRGHWPFTASELSGVEDVINSLSSQDDRDAFNNMSNVYTGAISPSTNEVMSAAEGIFQTNSFDMTDSVYGSGRSAMYLALARLNHSCRPNARQEHDCETTEEILYAHRDIEEGEEINDCYIDLTLCRRERKKLLRELYRFECRCLRCEPKVDKLGNNVGWQEGDEESEEDDDSGNEEEGNGSDEDYDDDGDAGRGGDIYVPQDNYLAI